MSILTCHYGTIVIVTLGNLKQPFPTGILRTFLIFTFGNTGIKIVLFQPGIKTADHINSHRIGSAIHPLRPFIMNRTGGIEVVQPSGNSSKVRTVPTLITHTPHHN